MYNCLSMLKPVWVRDHDGTKSNDGKCSPEGRFWAGTMELPGAADAGALYRLDPDHSCHTVMTGATISNGLVWTRDGGTMYYIDLSTRSVVASPYDQANGALGEPRVGVDSSAVTGVPDGMAIDAMASSAMRILAAGGAVLGSGRWFPPGRGRRTGGQREGLCLRRPRIAHALHHYPWRRQTR